MKNLLSILFSILFMASSFAQDDERLKGIDKTLNQILEETKAAGFAVAVVDRDRIIYAKGFGYRDYENKIPVDANTLFAIGSSSKAFTSSILGQLRADDKLSFDESPIKYIPELRFNNQNMDNNIIIKDLMCHRTGLPRHDFSWYLFPTPNKDSLLYRIEHQEPFTGVREKWYYNNFMFLAQGVIAERITGKSWEENIRERFFKKLNMNRSNTTIQEMKDAENAAFGYDLEQDSIITKLDYYDISGMSPAGSINSSVNDMSNWVITWINGGKYKDQEVLPAPYVSEAMSGQMVVDGGLPDDEFPDMHFGNYGYGWLMSSYRGHYRVEHGGNIDGFSANVAFFPSDSIGIIVLANQNGSAVPSLVRNTIADRMLNTELTDWAERFQKRKEKAMKETEDAKKNIASSKVTNTRTSHILQEYAGKYNHPGYGEFNMTVENDSLFANFSVMKMYLKHYHYDVFEPFEVKKSGIDTSDSGGLRFNFLTNDAGEISAVKIKTEPTIDAVEFKHAISTIEVDKENLESYVGEFDLAGTTIKVYVKNENKLFLFIKGQPEYEMLATSKHKFSFKALEGFKAEFIESEDGSIDVMTLIQPNGTFNTKRKK